MKIAVAGIGYVGLLPSPLCAVPPKQLGIYRLVMKVGSDNFHTIKGIMKLVKAKSIELVVYESTLKYSEFYHTRTINDLAEFKI